jgi:hypothetical protein
MRGSTAQSRPAVAGSSAHRWCWRCYRRHARGRSGRRPAFDRRRSLSEHKANRAGLISFGGPDLIARLHVLSPSGRSPRQCPSRCLQLCRQLDASHPRRIPETPLSCNRLHHRLGRNKKLRTAKHSDQPVGLNEKPVSSKHSRTAASAKCSFGSMAPPGNVQRPVSASSSNSSRPFESKTEMDAAAMVRRSWPTLARTAARCDDIGIEHSFFLTLRQVFPLCHPVPPGSTVIIQCSIRPLDVLKQILVLFCSASPLRLLKNIRGLFATCSIQNLGMVTISACSYLCTASSIRERLEKSGLTGKDQYGQVKAVARWKLVRRGHLGSLRPPARGASGPDR